MAYEFAMSFVQCKSKAKALKLACKAVDCVWENLNETISNAKQHDKNNPVLKGGKETAEYKLWLETNLKMSFLWWPEYKLLALAGDIWPNDVKALFTKEIVFSNIDSMPYEFSTWENVCDLFDKAVYLAKTGNTDTVKEMLKTEEPWPEEEDLCQRKTAVYKYIFSALGLWQWLYGQETETFYRFAMSVLTSLGRNISARNSLLIMTSS